MESLDYLDATRVKGPGVSVHVVLDNDATHKTPAVKWRLLRHPEYYLHFIPMSGSWPNQIERLFAAITEGRVRRGAFRSVPALVEAIDESIETHNADPKPLTWVADADSILDRTKKVCVRASDSGHQDEASTRFSLRTAPPKGGVPQRSGLRSPQSAAIKFARQSRSR